MNHGPTPPTAATLKLLAEQAGLALSDEELVGLLPGVVRTKAMAGTLRSLLRDPLEPAPIFTAGTRP